MFVLYVGMVCYFGSELLFLLLVGLIWVQAGGFHVVRQCIMPVLFWSGMPDVKNLVGITSNYLKTGV